MDGQNLEDPKSRADMTVFIQNQVVMSIFYLVGSWKLRSKQISLQDYWKSWMEMMEILEILMKIDASSKNN